MQREHHPRRVLLPRAIGTQRSGRRYTSMPQLLSCHHFLLHSLLLLLDSPLWHRPCEILFLSSSLPGSTGSAVARNEHHFSWHLNSDKVNDSAKAYSSVLNMYTRNKQREFHGPEARASMVIQVPQAICTGVNLLSYFLYHANYFVISGAK